jgi:hypothetical protein
LQRIYRNKTKDLLEVKMANDSQRDKARATFGKTFFENSKALPNPKNAAAALQKRANDRPIPTYKVGGSVKKSPPQPTAAEREAERKRRESLAKAKVTQSEADTLGRAMRSEGPGYKHGGKIAKYKQGSGATKSSSGRGSEPIQNLNYNLLSGSGGSGGSSSMGPRLSPTTISQPSSSMAAMAGQGPPKGYGIKFTKKFKKGGTAEKRAMKAEQDFTGLMRDAAARAAAKGTPVMKDGGATNEYTAKRVMSRIKAGNFKEGGRADMLRDRRMKDIEKDYKIALAKGKNEGVAKAKYEQRKADAADDYAKRTKADRTATRAAEKASEAALTEARRTKGMSMLARGEPKAVTTEASVAKVTDSLGAMSVPKMDRSIGAKPAAKTVRKPVQKLVQQPKPSASDTARARTALAASNLPSDQGFSGKPRVLGASKPTAVAPAVVTPKPVAASKGPSTKTALNPNSLAGMASRMFTSEAMAERNAEYAKRQKARGYAAGGAGKVRKGMMKGK